MSRNNQYDNPFDPDDDGSDVGFTAEQEAASDDDGRELAATYIAQAASIGGYKKIHEDHRRMWLRMAREAILAGVERRRTAERAEKARAKEAARVAAKEDAARTRATEFRTWCDGFDSRMAALDEQTRRENAAWEAGRPAREAAGRAATADAAKPATNAMSAPPRIAGPTGQGKAQRPAGPAAPSPKPAVNHARPSIRREAVPSMGKPARTDTALRSPGTATGPGPKPRSEDRSRHPGGPAAIPLTPPPTMPASAPRAAPVPPARSASPAPPATRANAVKPTLSTSFRADKPMRVVPPNLSPTQPLPPPPPPAAPAVPVPPAFTGADLAAYRATLGLSQGALAERLGSTQGTVSKAEGNPTALLGPTLRMAMWNAQRGAGGTSR